MVPVRLPGAIEIALGTSRGAPLGEPEDGLSGVAGFGSVCARNVQLQRGAAHKGATTITRRANGKIPKTAEELEWRGRCPRESLPPRRTRTFSSLPV